MKKSACVLSTELLTEQRVAWNRSHSRHSLQLWDLFQSRFLTLFGADSGERSSPASHSPAQSCFSSSRWFTICGLHQRQSQQQENRREEGDIEWFELSLRRSPLET